MKNEHVERYSDELSFILSTPPSWIIKYGQFLILCFFIVSLIILVLLPSRRTINFDVIATYYHQEHKRELNFSSLSIEKNDFLKLSKGQKSIIIMYEGPLKNRKLDASVVDLYTQVRDSHIFYYALIRLNHSILYTSYIKYQTVGTCVVEVSNKPLLNF